MKLTAFTDYSLRVLIYLAAQPGQRATIAEIATAFDVSENHLTKVVHFLGKAGWLANVRGKGGGLALPTLQTLGLSEADIYAEPELRTPAQMEKKLGGAKAVKAFYAVLDGYTLADLVRNRKQLASIMFVDRAARPAPTRRA